jgi:hypothetical protein
MTVGPSGRFDCEIVPVREDNMSDKVRVIDMIQSTQHAYSKVFEFASEHPESQFLYEAWHNLERAKERLEQYYRQQYSAFFPGGAP